MLRPRNILDTEIQYILVTDHRPLLFPFIPPEELNNTVLNFIKYVPKNLLQLDNAVGYFEYCKRSGSNNPTRFGVIYSTNFESYSKEIPPIGVSIFLIDFKIKFLDKVLDILNSMNNQMHYYYVFNSDEDIAIGDGRNNVNSAFELLNVLLRDQKSILALLGYPNVEFRPNVDMYDKEFHSFPLFKPAITNYHLASSIFGNFLYGGIRPLYMGQDIRKLEEAETQKAFENPSSFERQETILKQIKKIDWFSLICFNEGLVRSVHVTDPYFTPLILVIPFHNPDVKDLIREDDKNHYFNAVIQSLDTEQTENYISNAKSKVDLNPNLVTVLGRNKIDFLDNVSTLHASFHFSPVLRLPSQGRSIYKNLSFFRIEAMSAISKPEKRQNINKTIKRFGKELSKRVNSEKLIKNFKSHNRQIVAIGDLPVEWMDVDGIPLAFTHDVCRLPESSMHGLMATFRNNERFEYKIQNDILRKTLVIFGSEERAFKIWQNVIMDLSKDLGFQTRVCLDVKSAVSAIQEIKPDFLIFDCHGGVDSITKESFLMLGDEKLTGNLIVESQITAPLVFLSACSTAPTYGTINTIANAFFEQFSLSVTTTYLPINVHTGSRLYARILSNLRIASCDPIHSNWLAFLSHNIRTSAISEAYSFLLKNQPDRKKVEIARQSQSEAYTLSMSFYHRRKVFEEMDNNLNFLSGKDLALFSKTIPEYLFYSNLGRGDLIKFESYENKFQELNIDLNN